METLETPRLLLRDFVESDWKAVQEYARDPEVVAFLPWGPNSVDQTLEFLRGVIDEARAPKRMRYDVALVLKEEERLIGGAHLHVLFPEHRCGDIGFVVNRTFWKQGYATEAARALVAFGFQRLGLHRIFAGCDPSNAASARVLEKAGLKREGHLREHRWEKGDWKDSLIYAILHQEWKGLKEAGFY